MPRSDKGSFNFCVHLHTTKRTYNEGASSIKIVQANEAILFLTWVHEDPTLFREGRRIIYELKEGAKHKSQEVK